MRERQYQPHPIESVTPVIAILDIDCFECQLYQRESTVETKGRPCAVVNKGGRLVSQNYEAKRCGVNRNDTPWVGSARRICPRLFVFDKPDKFEKQDNSKCRAGTHEVTKCVENFLNVNYPEVVMEVSYSDEVYLNITSVVSRRYEEFEAHRKKLPLREAEAACIYIPCGIVWERSWEQKVGPVSYKVPHKPKQGLGGMMLSQKSYVYKNEERLIIGAKFMREVGAHLKKTTGLYSSSGVASNRLLAKIACGLNKPMNVTLLPEESLPRVAQEVPIASVPGLGGILGEKLQEEFPKVRMMADVETVDYADLEAKLGIENAQSVWSRSKGKDETPVIQKLYKDKITINKPKDDIWKIERLRVVLHYLFLEIVMLLGEEAERWGRGCEEVVVSWKLDSYEMGLSEIFRICSTDGSLEDRVFDAIHAAPGFDPSDFFMIELSFCLRNWIPIKDGMTPSNVDQRNSSEEEEEDNAAGRERKLSDSTTLSEDSGISCASVNRLSNKLRVHTDLPEIIPEFRIQECLGNFRINEDLSCTFGKKATIPTLVPDDQLAGLRGYHLLKHYNFRAPPPGALMDYTTFNTIKHEYFSQWLQDNDVSLEGIDFVCFMGRLLRPLKTPWNKVHGDWSMYAMNSQGVIHIWDEQCNRAMRQQSKAQNTYAGYLFEHLITGEHAEWDPVDCITKTFPVQKASFGKHRILILGHVDAQDAEGGLVQATVQKDEAHFVSPNPSELTERTMKLWAQTILSGANSVVIGTKDKRNRVRALEHFSAEEFLSGFDRQEGDKSFVFLHRLLDWMKEHLPVSDAKLVKRFAWSPTEPGKVHCSIEPVSEVCKLLVPKIYFKEKRAPLPPPVVMEEEAVAPTPPKKKTRRRGKRGKGTSHNPEPENPTEMMTLPLGEEKGPGCSWFRVMLARAYRFLYVMTTALLFLFRYVTRREHLNVMVHIFLLIVVSVFLWRMEVDHLK